MTKCAVYARVSTEDQTEENQIQPLLNVAAQRGYEVHEIYREQASAWKNGHQRELARLFEDGRRGKFQVVLIFALNRLSREGALQALLYFKKFAEYGITCISLQESWTELPSGFRDVLISMLAWLAKEESDRKSAAVKAGMARVAATGKHMGRPRKVK